METTVNLHIIDLINNLIDELNPDKISNQSYLHNFLREINTPIFNSLIIIKNTYNSNQNIFELLNMFVKMGVELENTYQVNKNTNDIISIQTNFFSSLIIPILKKIKKICFEINNELVKEVKKNIISLIETNCEDKNINVDLNKKTKYLQVNSFYKNILYNEDKELFFEDFGIGIKILNTHYKEFYLKIINELEIFTQNDHLKDKKFDWYWRPIQNYILNKNNQNNNKNNILQEQNNLENNNYFNNQNDINNIVHVDIKNMEPIEDFKIIQKIPKKSLSENNTKSQKIVHEEISKIISNSIIIEDDSFSIPIAECDSYNDLSNYNDNKNC